MIASINLVFYEQGQFPEVSNAAPQGERSRDIQSLVSSLVQSPLFGQGLYLGPNAYREQSRRQVSFHKEIRGEPLFCWDKDCKKEGVTEPDKIIIRGTQLVEGKWVVYYSVSNAPTPLYFMLYEIFQQRVTIHPPQSPLPKRYNKVLGGPGLSQVAEQFVASLGSKGCVQKSSD